MVNCLIEYNSLCFFFFQAEDGIRDLYVTGVQTCALPIFELAYRLTRSSWGQGLATEAANTFLDYALGVVALPRIVAVTYPNNRASQRVLEKLGFLPRGLIDYKGVQVAYYVVTRATRNASGPR